MRQQHVLFLTVWRGEGLHAPQSLDLLLNWRILKASWISWGPLTSRNGNWRLWTMTSKCIITLPLTSMLRMNQREQETLDDHEIAVLNVCVQQVISACIRASSSNANPRRITSHILGHIQKSLLSVGDAIKALTGESDDTLPTWRAINWLQERAQRCPCKPLTHRPQWWWWAQSVANWLG